MPAPPPPLPPPPPPLPPSSSNTNTTKKAKTTTAATTLEFVRIKNWRRARASDDRQAWAGYARDSNPDRGSERRNGRASEEAETEDLDGVALLPPPLMPSGALPDEMERAEWWLPLVVIEGTAAAAFIIFSAAVACMLSATAAALPLFDKALDRRVMPMPPVLLGEVAYRPLPVPVPPLLPLADV